MKECKREMGANSNVPTNNSRSTAGAVSTANQCVALFLLACRNQPSCCLQDHNSGCTRPGNAVRNFVSRAAVMSKANRDLIEMHKTYSKMSYKRLPSRRRVFVAGVAHQNLVLCGILEVIYVLGECIFRVLWIVHNDNVVYLGLWGSQTNERSENATLTSHWQPQAQVSTHLVVHEPLVVSFTPGRYP